MKKEYRFAKILRSVHHYFVFFLIVAFVISCCMMLFVSVMRDSMGLTLTENHIQVAAKLTFLNVILLTLILTVLDGIRRKFTVERPVKKITEAAQKLMEGDFSIRIETIKAFGMGSRFEEIADCFNKMAEELSGVETLRTDFIANVSHELKTPLAVMQNYGTLLQQKDLSEEQRLEYAKAITDASRRLASLITNILKLNKLENQQLTPTAAVYDLSEQLCQCLLGFEEAWEKKGLNIETEIQDGILVKADREMMSLVWNNLFSNAIKFTEKGGTVSLTVKEEGESAVVQIRDTGCGISGAVGARMFDKFYQGDTSHAGEGNGLGLALVKRVIDLSGSDIAVESTLGKGTVFTVKMRRWENGEG